MNGWRRKENNAGNETLLEEEKKERPMQKYRISGSLTIRIIAYILLVVFVLTGTGAILIYDYCKADFKEILEIELQRELEETVDGIRGYLVQGQPDSAENLCDYYAVDVELVWPHWNGREEVMWSTWDGTETGYKIEVPFYLNAPFNRVQIEEKSLYNHIDYVLRIYMNQDLSFQGAVNRVRMWYEMRGWFLVVFLLCSFLALLCSCFVIASAGRVRGREQIVPGLLTPVYLDVLALLLTGLCCAVFFGTSKVLERYGRQWITFITMSAAVSFITVMITIFLSDFTLRVKRGGKFWRNSLLYLVLRGLWKIIRPCGRKLLLLITVIPSVMKAVLIFWFVCIVEYIGIIAFVEAKEGIVFWGIEKVVLLFVVIYLSYICKRLLKAGRALAHGQDDYRVDTSEMFGEFKEHGENLNSMGQGIAKAVEEQTKSERLKTELISNVSHDLKTPLTSIINYANLICEETKGDRRGSGETERIGRGGNGEESETEGGAREAEDRVREEFEERNSRIREYSEVLLRQSRRLKRLLENLIEASKVTTGNVEVNLMPCEAGVLLAQAVGEYQQKMEEKDLELIARQPEQPVCIIADGRHLWRVFDNLLNNICKYAQEHSRVYLSVELKDDLVLIIFRNMSKYVLDISGEELEERFVRGDKSRHMEGNGLGLSIAKSLMELQNGKMEIITDGDLFKVILSFKIYRE